eukprot:UN0949
MRALKVPVRPQVSVEITNTVKGGDADWALGAAIVHVLQSSRSPSHGAGAQGSSGTDWLGIMASLAVVALLLTLVRILVWPRLKRLKQPKYSTSPEATKVGKVDNGPAE